MSATYRVGIIGCSRMAIGTRPRPVIDGRPGPPSSHRDGYADVPSTEVVAVCDPDPQALARYAEYWGEGAARYTSASDLLASEDLDIVSIVTPDNRHRAAFVEAAHAGVKGILCEKPIATSLADADAMIDATLATGVKAVINHTRRFDDRHPRVKAEIAAGALGPVRHISGMLGGSRAMLFRLGTHLVNTMLYFASSEPVWVQAAWSDRDAGFGAGYQGDGGRNPALEPDAVAIIGFADGTRAVYNASKEIASQFEVTVYGATGSVAIGNAGGEWRPGDPQDGETRRPLAGDRAFGPAIVPAIETLLHLIAHDGDPLPGLLDARQTLAVLLAITESAASQGARIPLPAWTPPTP